MAEYPKLQAYKTMAVQHTAAITGSFDTWTAFLRTAARIYKYSFLEQLMIHVQRPDATACAEYRLWSEKMNRHVRYGAKGIAIISEVDGVPALRYVFDISDTRPRANARTPWLWQYREEHQDTVAKMLEDCFQVPTDKGVSFQLAAVAAQFAQKYWETYREKILRAVKDTLLQKYDEADAGMAFQDAVAASVSYVLLCRCGLSPEQFFDAGTFPMSTNSATMRASLSWARRSANSAPCSCGCWNTPSSGMNAGSGPDSSRPPSRPRNLPRRLTAVRRRNPNNRKYPPR